MSTWRWLTGWLGAVLLLAAALGDDSIPADRMWPAIAAGAVLVLAAAIWREGGEDS